MPFFLSYKIVCCAGFEFKAVNTFKYIKKSRQDKHTISKTIKKLSCIKT